MHGLGLGTVNGFWCDAEGGIVKSLEPEEWFAPVQLELVCGREYLAAHTFSRKMHGVYSFRCIPFIEGQTQNVDL